MTKHLEGPIADCIPSFSLMSKNYVEVTKLLEEQFGNTQAITSAHMNVLLKLPKLNNKNVVKLISLYNAIETNLQSLMTMTLNPFHYGLLLIPLISERLPRSIRLIVTRMLGKDNCNITDFITTISIEPDWNYS